MPEREERAEDPSAAGPSAPRSSSRPFTGPFAVSLAIYALVEVVLIALTPAARLHGHTPFNHFALLAETWLHGHLDLPNGPPEYTGFNDFAVYGEKIFVSFPPLPALLILPLVALCGSAEATPDGLFFVVLAGLAPAILHLALDALSASGRSRRTARENALLAILFAFGTVYFFTSTQGTVWFAAHVVGAACAAGYLYASIGAERPALAGLCLGLGFATRTPLAFAFPLFAFELWRAARLAEDGSTRVLGLSSRVLTAKAPRFVAPLVVVLGVLAWHNRARFGDVTEFGHKYLAIVWKARIERWGLFSFHYLGRNLAIALASMPWLGQKAAPFVVNAHGLALTVTSPFFAWALWPRAEREAGARATHAALALTALAVAAPSLLYQNSGWIQFGYRFSNDFAPFLVAMIAVGGRRFGPTFAVLAAFAVAVNAFGAATFQRAGFERYYHVDGTQRVIFEPD